MAKLTVETIPPIPVEPQKRFVLELTRDEMHTLYALCGHAIPKNREGQHLADIYHALAVECRGTVKCSNYMVKMRDSRYGAFFFERNEEST